MNAKGKQMAFVMKINARTAFANVGVACLIFMSSQFTAIGQTATCPPLVWGLQGEKTYRDKCAGIEVKENKDFYRGSFINNKYDGKGELFLSNGVLYDGLFKNGNFEGDGRLTYPQGDTYIGIFNNGNFVKGTFISNSGTKYVGTYKKNGHRVGKGTFTDSDRSEYHGDFDNDRFNGFGILKYANGDKYEGKWIDSEYGDNGTYRFSNGEKLSWNQNSAKDHRILGGYQFFGNFSKSTLNGSVNIILPDGITVKGLIDSSWRPYRSVSVQYADGRRYDGEIDASVMRREVHLDEKGFLKNQFVPSELETNEFGPILQQKMESPSTFRFEFRGIPQGIGKMIHPNGDEYEGVFNQGSIENGKFTSRNDDYVYNGAFKNNKAEGYGIRTHRDERRYVGYFENGEFCNGTIYYPMNRLVEIGKICKNPKYSTKP